MNFKTKIGHLFKLAIFASAMMGSSAWAELSKVDDVYQIKTAQDLVDFASKVNGGEYGANAVLTTDIDMSSTSWTPIGKYETTGSGKNITDLNKEYVGTFNGKGFSIVGLSYTTTDNYVGLFGAIKGATIENVNLASTCSISGGRFVGGICGYNVSGGTITNCSNAGTVSGTGESDKNGYVGGICGYNGGTITNCSNTGSITCAKEDAGGICGHNTGTITNVYNTGNVSGSQYIGGVCGSLESGSVTNCYNTGSVTGSGDYVGGVCGKIAKGTTLSVCYNTGTVTGGRRSSNVHAVCGQLKGSMTNCYYLTGSGTADKSKNSTAMKSDQFASGEVAYDLQQVSKNWGQGDNLPILGGGTEDSYPATLYENTNCQGVTVYTTSELVNSHLYTWKTAKEATCSEVGSRTGICQYCATPVTEEIAINSEAHSWGEWVESDATCTSESYKKRVCQYNAAHSEVVSTGTAALGHDYNASGICTRTNCGAYQPATLNNGVYEIANAGQLYWFSSQVNSGTEINAVLTTNISLSGLSGWTPIGTSEKHYTGTFDGNGKTISGLTISTTEDSVGLFGVNSGIIKNVAMTGSSISGGNYVGSICGYNEVGIIVNCYNTSSVTGNSNVGGICGFNEGILNSDDVFEGGVYNCYNTGSVDGANRGGICGEYGNKATANCYSNTTDRYAASKDVDNFKSGEVAVLLQMWADKSSYSDLMNWSQTYGTDSPIFGGSSIDYTRSIPNNVWGTLCLPYEFTVPNSDLSFYNVKGVENNTLVLSPADGVTPGTPVVYYYTGEDSLLKVSIDSSAFGTPATLTANNSLLYGVYENTTVKAADVANAYYLKEDKFLKINESFIANPFRAYIKTPAPAGAPKAPKSLALSLANNASNDSEEEAATVTESHIVAIYNISGQQVDKMDRGGIYLVKMSDGSTKKVRITE